MDFIETPIKPLKIRVGKDSKMSNKSTTKAEAPAKSYNKTRGEHFKDIVIAVLVVGVIAFIAGVHYSDSKNAQMQSAVKAAQTTAVAPDVKK